ncbi:MAG: hypothetical protein LW822_09705, partial [Phycisphaeraceae bacterium]|nr:hypothetical protein [Phycisphaeraceae bacterium]
PPLALTGASGTRWHNQSNCSSVNRIAMRLYWHHDNHRLRGFGIGSSKPACAQRAGPAFFILPSACPPGYQGDTLDPQAL